MITDLLSRIKLDKLAKLDLDKLKLDKNKLTLVAVGAALMLYLDLAFIMKAQWRYIARTGPKIVKLKKDIKTLAADLARMKDAERGRQPAAAQEASRKVKKLISEEQIPLLLQFISDAANRRNVSVMQMRPSKDYKGKAGATPSASLKVSPVFITLNMSCDYHHLGQFINDLENAEDLIMVEEARISPGKDTYLSQNVSLVLKTYVKK